MAGEMECRLNDSSQQLYHLRRIGLPRTRPLVVDVMDFYKVISIIGRECARVDFYIDSINNVQSKMISRSHARVIRQPNNQHKLFDDSLNGVFVNNIKIRGSVVLNEGDRVTFGHPAGNTVEFNAWVRQPSSEYQFIFERCNCPVSSEKSPDKTFATPRTSRAPSSLKKKRERNETRTMTQEEWKVLKRHQDAIPNNDLTVPRSRSNENHSLPGVPSSALKGECCDFCTETKEVALNNVKQDSNHGLNNACILQDANREGIEAVEIESEQKNSRHDMSDDVQESSSSVQNLSNCSQLISSTINSSANLLHDTNNESKSYPVIQELPKPGSISQADAINAQISEPCHLPNELIQVESLSTPTKHSQEVQDHTKVSPPKHASLAQLETKSRTKDAGIQTSPIAGIHILSSIVTENPSIIENPITVEFKQPFDVSVEKSNKPCDIRVTEDTNNPETEEKAPTYMLSDSIDFTSDMCGDDESEEDNNEALFDECNEIVNVEKDTFEDKKGSKIKGNGSLCVEDVTASRSDDLVVLEDSTREKNELQEENMDRTEEKLIESTRMETENNATKVYTVEDTSCELTFDERGRHFQTEKQEDFKCIDHLETVNFNGEFEVNMSNQKKDEEKFGILMQEDSANVDATSQPVLRVPKDAEGNQLEEDSNVRSSEFEQAMHEVTIDEIVEKSNTPSKKSLQKIFRDFVTNSHSVEEDACDGTMAKHDVAESDFGTKFSKPVVEFDHCKEEKPEGKFDNDLRTDLQVVGLEDNAIVEQPVEKSDDVTTKEQSVLELNDDDESEQLTGELNDDTRNDQNISELDDAAKNEKPLEELDDDNRSEQSLLELDNAPETSENTVLRLADGTECIQQLVMEVDDNIEGQLPEEELDDAAKSEQPVFDDKISEEHVEEQDDGTGNEQPVSQSGDGSENSEQLALAVDDATENSEQLVEELVGGAGSKQLVLELDISTKVRQPVEELDDQANNGQSVNEVNGCMRTDQEIEESDDSVEINQLVNETTKNNQSVEKVSDIMNSDQSVEDLDNVTKNNYSGDVTMTDQLVHVDESSNVTISDQSVEESSNATESDQSVEELSNATKSDQSVEELSNATRSDQTIEDSDDIPKSGLSTEELSDVTESENCMEESENAVNEQLFEECNEVVLLDQPVKELIQTTDSDQTTEEVSDLEKIEKMTENSDNTPVNNQPMKVRELNEVNRCDQQVEENVEVVVLHDKLSEEWIDSTKSDAPVSDWSVEGSVDVGKCDQFVMEENKCVSCQDVEQSDIANVELKEISDDISNYDQIFVEEGVAIKEKVMVKVDNVYKGDQLVEDENVDQDIINNQPLQEQNDDAECQQSPVQSDVAGRSEHSAVVSDVSVQIKHHPSNFNDIARTNIHGQETESDSGTIDQADQVVKNNQPVICTNEVGEIEEGVHPAEVSADNTNCDLTEEIPDVRGHHSEKEISDKVGCALSASDEISNFKHVLEHPDDVAKDDHPLQKTNTDVWVPESVEEEETEACMDKKDPSREVMESSVVCIAETIEEDLGLDDNKDYSTDDNNENILPDVQKSVVSKEGKRLRTEEAETDDDNKTGEDSNGADQIPPNTLSNDPKPSCSSSKNLESHHIVTKRPSIILESEEYSSSSEPRYSLTLHDREKLESCQLETSNVDLEPRQSDKNPESRDSSSFIETESCQVGTEKSSISPEHSPEASCSSDGSPEMETETKAGMRFSFRLTDSVEYTADVDSEGDRGDESEDFLKDNENVSSICNISSTKTIALQSREIGGGNLEKKFDDSYLENSQGCDCGDQTAEMLNCDNTESSLVISATSQETQDNLSLANSEGNKNDENDCHLSRLEADDKIHVTESEFIEETNKKINSLNPSESVEEVQSSCQYESNNQTESKYSDVLCPDDDPEIMHNCVATKLHNVHVDDLKCDKARRSLETPSSLQSHSLSSLNSDLLYTWDIDATHLSNSGEDSQSSNNTSDLRSDLSTGAKTSFEKNNGHVQKQKEETFSTCGSFPLPKLEEDRKSDSKTRQSENPCDSYENGKSAVLLNSQSRKRKISQESESNPVERKGKKLRLSEESLKIARKCVSDFFKIRESFWKRNKGKEIKCIRQDLVGNIVRHFFKSYKNTSLLDERSMHDEDMQLQDSKKIIFVKSENYVEKLDLSENGIMNDEMFSDNSENQIDLKMGRLKEESGKLETANESASKHFPETSDILEVLNVNDHDGNSVNSSQQSDIPVYQASIEPGCGITITLGDDVSQKTSKTQKQGNENEESFKPNETHEMETQVSSLEIDVETIALESAGHSLEDDCSLDQDTQNPEICYPGETDTNKRSIVKREENLSEMTMVKQNSVESISSPDRELLLKAISVIEESHLMNTKVTGYEAFDVPEGRITQRQNSSSQDNEIFLQINPTESAIASGQNISDALHGSFNKQDEEISFEENSSSQDSELLLHTISTCNVQKAETMTSDENGSVILYRRICEQEAQITQRQDSSSQDSELLLHTVPTLDTTEGTIVDYKNNTEEDPEDLKNLSKKSECVKSSCCLESDPTVCKCGNSTEDSAQPYQVDQPDSSNDINSVDTTIFRNTEDDQGRLSSADKIQVTDILTEVSSVKTQANDAECAEFDSDDVEIISTKTSSESDMELSQLEKDSLKTLEDQGQNIKDTQKIQNTSHIKNAKSHNVVESASDNMDSPSENITESSSDVDKLESSTTNMYESSANLNVNSVSEKESLRQSFSDREGDSEDISNGSHYINLSQGKHHLPSFGSDSPVNSPPVDKKPYEYIPPDILIDLDSSGDDLPEVVFLKEEKGEPSKKKEEDLILIKEEPLTPSHSLKTPIQISEKKSPRKRFRKTVFDKTPEKKGPKEGQSPPSKKRHLRLPRKRSEVLKPLSTRSHKFDSDVEIISASDSGDEFCQSEVKKFVKREIHTDSDDSDLPTAGYSQRKKEESSNHQKSSSASQKENNKSGSEKKSSSFGKQQAHNINELSLAVQKLENKSKEHAPEFEEERDISDRDSGLSKVSSQKLWEESPAGSLSDVFQSDGSRDSLPVSSTSENVKNGELDTVAVIDGRKLEENDVGYDDYVADTCPEEDDGEMYAPVLKPLSLCVSEATSLDIPVSEVPVHESSFNLQPLSPVIPKAAVCDKIKSPNTNINRQVPSKIHSSGVDGHSGETSCVSDVMSPYNSQALSPVIPQATSCDGKQIFGNVDNCTKDSSSSHDQDLPHLISPLRKRPSVLPDMEFDSESEFSAPVVDLKSLNSPSGESDNGSNQNEREELPSRRSDGDGHHKRETYGSKISETSEECYKKSSEEKLVTANDVSVAFMDNDAVKSPYPANDCISDSDHMEPDPDMLSGFHSPKCPSVCDDNDSLPEVPDEMEAGPSNSENFTTRSKSSRTRKKRVYDDIVNLDDEPEPSSVEFSESKKRKMNSSDEQGIRNPEPKRKRISEPEHEMSEGEDKAEMFISTQVIQDFSSTQMEKATQKLENDQKSPTKKSRAQELMEKLKAKRAKREQTKEKSSPARVVGTPLSSQETPGELPSASQIQRRLLRESYREAHKNTLDYIKRCKSILESVKTSFSSTIALNQNPRIQQWKKDLTDIETKISLPKTVIAVVGDTGAGKSSLMNALIDQLDVLPTSGMRACTAVVVEVVQNSVNDKFEADITFLSKEEWYAELELLLKDLTGLDGKIKKSTPDPNSEAGVAFLKIKAVYGKIDKFAILSRLQTVTKWLGRVRTISREDATDFRNAIDQYIETSDPGVGGQFWPIVKQVTIRLPKCDVCSTGAVLVDLPGVRDSNAARDKIARDYLKKCTAVWVVSSIHRAIDDKTAKDLLGENFRRQLLMDGQYGNIAFICTKSDIIKNSEIIRGLKLKDMVQPLEADIGKLEQELGDLEQSIKDNRRCIRSMESEGRKLYHDLEEEEEFLREEQEIDLESEEYKEFLEELTSKREAVKRHDESIKSYEKEINDAEKKVLRMEKKINQRRKEISSVCAKARNDYSKTQIKKDFKAGLREMKRKAGMTTQEEEEEEDYLYNSDEDEDDVGSSAENLQVFCVSSTEYQKMKNILTNDGPPSVFSTEEETQIPALRTFVHKLTSVRQRQGLERLIQRLAQFVFDVQNYLTDEGCSQSKGARMKSRKAIECHTSRLMQKFDPVLQTLSGNFESAINNQLRPKLGEGITTACESATDIAAKWSAPRCKENRQEGGLHWKTYQCVVRRQGVFNSPTYGSLNFNEDLIEPVYTSISIVWDRVFSGILWGFLEKCKISLLGVLKVFIIELCEELHSLGVEAASTQRVNKQVLESATHKLTEMVSVLKDFVSEKQRDANRVLTPRVQENLIDTYDFCASESGTGTYDRMKNHMFAGVDKSRYYMFDDSSRKLLEELEQIKKEVVHIVREVCRSLCFTVQAAYEPLWETPSNSKLLKEAIFSCITDSSLEVNKLLEDTNIQLPAAERSLVPASETRNDGEPGTSGIGTVATVAKGSQVHTKAYQGVQQVVTNCVGLPQNFVLEEVRSTYVTDLSGIKSEPKNFGDPIHVQAIKKEWSATDSCPSKVALHFKDVGTRFPIICKVCGSESTGIVCERCQRISPFNSHLCRYCGNIGSSPSFCTSCHTNRKGGPSMPISNTQGNYTNSTPAVAQYSSPVIQKGYGKLPKYRVVPDGRLQKVLDSTELPTVAREETVQTSALPVSVPGLNSTVELGRKPHFNENSDYNQTIVWLKVLADNVSPRSVQKCSTLPGNNSSSNFTATPKSKGSRLSLSQRRVPSPKLASSSPYIREQSSVQVKTEPGVLTTPTRCPKNCK